MSVAVVWRILCICAITICVCAVGIPQPAAYGDDTPESVEREARDYAVAGKFDKAAETYAALIARFPESPLAGRGNHDAMLECYIRAQKWEEAVSAAQDIISKYPEEAALCHYKAATCRIALKDYRAAAGSLLKCMDAAREPAQAGLRQIAMDTLAAVCELPGDWAAYVVQAEKLAAQYPNEAALWQLKARYGYQKQGKRAEADAALKKAVELVSDPAVLSIVEGRTMRKTVMSALLDSYAESGEWEKLVKQAEELAASDPKDAALWYLRSGMGHQKLGRSAAALDAFQKAVDLATGPENGDTRRQAMQALAGCYEAASDWQNLCTLAEKLAAEEPGQAIPWLLKAKLAYEKQGKTTEAAAALAKAVEAATDPQSRRTLADSYEQSHDWAAFVPLAEKLAVEFAQEAASWQYRAAMALLRQGKNTEAAAALKKAVESAGTSADQANVRTAALQALAGVYELAKDWENLTTLAEQLVSEFPNEAANWYLKMSIGLENQHKPRESLAALEKGMEAATKQGDRAMLKGMNDRLTQLYRLHNLGDAESLLTKLAEEYPEDAATYLFWHAMCLKNKADYAGAAARFQQVYDKHTDHIMGQNALMEVYACLLMVPGKKAEAEAAFKKLWDNHPDFRPEALFIQAEVQTGFMHDPEAATTCLRRLSKDYPESVQAKRPETTLMLTHALERSGNVDEAIVHQRRTLHAKSEKYLALYRCFGCAGSYVGSCGGGRTNH